MAERRRRKSRRPYISEEEDQEIRAQKLEDFRAMMKVQELRERLNYTSLVMQKLFDVFEAPDEESWQENIRRLYLMIPASWRDKEFDEAVANADERLSKTLDEIAEDQVLTEEEEVVYEADLNEYWEDVLAATIRLFDARGLLVPVKQREFVP